MPKKSSRKMSKIEAEIIDKWLFILLSVNDYEGITGRIRMTKEFFLIAKEHVPELWESVEFFPYHFGPYSTRLAVRVNTLSREGYITASSSNSDWSYHLTPEGRHRSIDILDSSSKELIEVVAEIKKRHKRKGLRLFLREIYEKYPNFASRSLITPTYFTETIRAEEVQIDDGPGFVATQKVGKGEIFLKEEAAQRFLNCLKEY